MECCDVKVFVEEIKQIVHLLAFQVQCNTHQTMSKLGLSQRSRTVAFLTTSGGSIALTNTHDLIKYCLSEDLILAYVLNKRWMGFEE